MAGIGMLALGIAALKVLLSLGGVLGFLLIPFGLPGNWLIALCALPGPWIGLGWTPFLIQLGLASLAELFEFTSALKHARRSGASRAGGWGGILGSIVGAFLLTGLVPVPILGTLLGAAIGAFAGAFLAEIAYSQRSHGDGLQSGWGAFLGTLIGKFLKLALGAAQMVLLGLHLAGLL
ncbi:MAG: hypothetical protein CMJ94_08680 [Planctomycetes bacterium]|nr:hypothetical protein [Planctomycetota bacterium]